MPTERDLSPKQYEQLTKSLVQLISERSALPTTRLEHNVSLQGLATKHQIDVVWEFEVLGHRHRVIFECRRYGRTIEQKHLFAFKGVVDDLETPELPTVGVMVTSTGYQSGAQAVAKTYGLYILQLREPNDKDVAGRVLKVVTTFNVRMPVVRDLAINVAESQEMVELPPMSASDIEIDIGSGVFRRAIDLALDGELKSFGEEPAPLHGILRTFDPPAILRVPGHDQIMIQSLSATVGEVAMDPFEVAVGGRERLAWMLKETLGGSCIWFEHDGTFYTSDGASPPFMLPIPR